ncbi:MAG: ATP-NAD kinase family protein [Anaerolineae bacterium]|nr:ATP-NAD kinase family protein [Anaerolineae bacterium]
MSKKKIGLIVNPVAGLGGRVGLKGSDGLDTQRQALALGAVPQASARAVQALERLSPLAGQFDLIAYPGEMGEAAARAAGLAPAVIGAIQLGRTTAEDTRRAAAEMLALPVDLLLFAGGDGTARDVCQAVGQALPVLGIPAGVKIHSAVYATSPAGAGDLAALYLWGKVTSQREAEVMDVDEDAVRQGVMAASLYGYLLIPFQRRLVQSRKAPSDPGEAAAMEAIACQVVDGMELGHLYILGPGTTTRAIATRLGLAKTLTGVDVILDGRLLAADVSEAQLLALLPGRSACIVVTPIGGQGYLFGRGNQQISPAVIRAVGCSNITIVSAPHKVHSLEGRPFLVDTGDPALDRLLTGYVRVTTGHGEQIVYRVSL